MFVSDMRLPLSVCVKPLSTSFIRTLEQWKLRVVLPHMVHQRRAERPRFCTDDAAVKLAKGMLRLNVLVLFGQAIKVHVTPGTGIILCAVSGLDVFLQSSVACADLCAAGSRAGIDSVRELTRREGSDGVGPWVRGRRSHGRGGCCPEIFHLFYLAGVIDIRVGVDEAVEGEG